MKWRACTAVHYSDKREHWARPGGGGVGGRGRGLYGCSECYCEQYLLLKAASWVMTACLVALLLASIYPEAYISVQLSSASTIPRLVHLRPVN